jgi:hypothetical protein
MLLKILFFPIFLPTAQCRILRVLILQNPTHFTSFVFRYQHFSVPLKFLTKYSTPKIFPRNCQSCPRLLRMLEYLHLFLIIVLGKVPLLSKALLFLLNASIIIIKLTIASTNSAFQEYKKHFQVLVHLIKYFI